MQGALEWLGIPYTGSGVLASALTMDKLKTKRVVVGRRLRRPADMRCCPARRTSRERSSDVGSADDGQTRLAGLERRHHQGEGGRRSSQAAYRGGAPRRSHRVRRAFIDGRRIHGRRAQGAALPSIRIEPATEFYDYQAKYFRNDTQYHCPSGLDAAAEAELQAAALAAFRVTDCCGWGRVDFMRETAHRQILFHRDQHHARHDRSQPGADGGAPGRHRLRGAGVARARDQFHARARMN